MPKAQIEYEKVMIAERGEEAWNRLSADRSICPDNKWAYNLWQRLNLVSRGLQGHGQLPNSELFTLLVHLVSARLVPRILPKL